jgi:hypothetical protein
MKNFIKLFMTIALAVVISFSMTVCGGGDDDTGSGDKNPPPPPDKTPLTGTVTVTSDITNDDYNYHKEIMTLKADVSGLNGTSSSSYSYQWMKDGVNISGATSSTYVVKEADYGKTVRVKVTYFNYSGEQFGDFAVPNPTTLTLTLKRHASTWGKETGITIERENYSLIYWVTTQENLTTSGTTVTLTSWKETKFKMRTTYVSSFSDTKFYFKKDNASGSELFDLTNGTKTYILESIDGGAGLLTGLFAKEGS